MNVRVRQPETTETGLFVVGECVYLNCRGRLILHVLKKRHSKDPIDRISSDESSGTLMGLCKRPTSKLYTLITLLSHIDRRAKYDINKFIIEIKRVNYPNT